MMFTFRRDEEGSERIYIGDVPVAVGAVGAPINTKGWEPLFWPVGVSLCHMPDILDDAIERADEAGFWKTYWSAGAWSELFFNNNEITVDVPVAETAATLAVVREDE